MVHLNSEMEATFKRLKIDGSDQSNKELQSGKMYVLLFPGEGLRAKRVHRMADGRIKISSDNPDKAQFPNEYYSPEEVTHLNIVGKVVQREGGVRC